MGHALFLLHFYTFHAYINMYYIQNMNMHVCVFAYIHVYNTPVLYFTLLTLYRALQSKYSVYF